MSKKESVLEGRVGKVKPIEAPSYEDIYGITINEYCFVHDTTPKKLIDKVKTDIHILENNYNKYERIKHKISDREMKLVFLIKKQIKSKKAHLEKLEKYTK